MAAAKYNLLIEQGATFQRKITWKDSNSTPVNITGYRVRLQIRSSVTASTTLLNLDSNALGSGLTLGALDANGVIDFTFSEAVTAAMTFANGVYDLTMESPGGVVTRLVEGTVTVRPAVTHD